MSVFGSGNIWSLGSVGGGVSSVENGLYLASGVARLGGALIENTEIDFGAFYLRFGNANNYLQIEENAFATVLTFKYPANSSTLKYDGSFTFDNILNVISAGSTSSIRGDNINLLDVGGSTSFWSISGTRTEFSSSPNKFRFIGSGAQYAEFSLLSGAHSFWLADGSIDFSLSLNTGNVDFASTENTFKFRESSRSAARVQFDFSDSTNDVTLSLFSSAGSFYIFQPDTGNVSMRYVATKSFSLGEDGAGNRLFFSSGASNFNYPTYATGLDLQAGQGRLYDPSGSHYFEANSNWLALKLSISGVNRVFTADSRDDKLYIRAKDTTVITNQPNNSIAFRLDETANNLIIYARYSTGAAKVGTVALV